VAKLMDDMERFRERVLDLQRHFGQANQDIEKILTSSEKIAQRGRKIETLEFEEPVTPAIEQAQPPSPAAPAPPSDQVRGKLSPTRGEGVERKRNGGYRQPDLLAKEP
jgi:DNA recombination protein RmuC